MDRLLRWIALPNVSNNVLGVSCGYRGWLNLCSRINNVRSAKRAEELGFSHAWFYDTQMLSPDIFVTMALAATQTSKIKLGATSRESSTRERPPSSLG
jgi:Luciferase-like monooxygenase